MIKPPLCRVMTLPQVCEFLRVAPNTIYRMIKTKKIPSFRIGSEHRFSRETIDEWRKSQEAKQHALSRPSRSQV